MSDYPISSAGMVTIKNETNIMVKNAVDVIFSGLAFYLFGYGLSFGKGPLANAFCGVGDFAPAGYAGNEKIFASYFYQLAMSTTATTIVSGAMAERTYLNAYGLYSFTSTISSVMPAHWIWAEEGFLKKLGVHDVAGCCGVHIVGGVSGLVATIMLGPRYGRYDNNKHHIKARPQACSQTNVMLGTFMLWWGWLGITCGSTFGLSGGKYCVFHCP